MITDGLDHEVTPTADAIARALRLTGSVFCWETAVSLTYVWTAEESRDWIAYYDGRWHRTYPAARIEEAVNEFLRAALPRSAAA